MFSLILFNKKNRTIILMSNTMSRTKCTFNDGTLFFSGSYDRLKRGKYRYDMGPAYHFHLPRSSHLCWCYGGNTLDVVIIK